MVYSLTEAMNWFLSHHAGSVICVKGEEQKACDCYPDAEAFYNT